MEETPKNPENHEQLNGIQLTLSKLTALRARAIYLRKLSQENHVKRMILARKINHLSPAFILPTRPQNSPFRSAKPKASDVHLTFKSPDNKNDRVETFGKNDEKLTTKYSKTKNSQAIYLPASPEFNNNSKIPKVSFGTFTKNESPDRSASILNSNRPLLETLNSNKTRSKLDSNKKSPFLSKSPNRNWEENNSNTLELDSKKYSKPTQLRSSHLRKARRAFSVFKSTSNTKSEANQELLQAELSGYIPNVSSNGNRNKCNKKVQNHNIHESRYIPKQNTSIMHKQASKTMSSLEPLPKGKNKIVKSSYSGEQLPLETKPAMVVKNNFSNSHGSNKVKKKVSTTISEQFSADSLEEMKNASGKIDFLMPTTVINIQDNIEQNETDPLRNNNHTEDSNTKAVVKESPKKAKKQFFKFTNNSNISKIPISEFSSLNIKNQQRATEIPKASFIGDENARNEIPTFNQNDDCGAISFTSPLNNKISVISSWLKTVQEPSTIENKESNEERVGELAENSADLVKSSEANNSFMNEDKKNYFTSRESNDRSSASKKTSETETLKPAISSTSESISLSLTEPELNERNHSEKKSEFQNNLKIYNLSRKNRDFLVNPIEKFMKEINSVLNNSDSEEINTGSSSQSKVKKVVKSKRKGKCRKQIFKRKV
ncbi:hypothetical protein TNIN_137261 [Trichonephila inaurata madagascariensis]|uniref:Uncharacterized protein n=1 Tax=Trichonephila inaurata madagascariensis TaxID=2747483 RepID=A0A8X6X4S6_9ARAC|nr:hypothetical protein TNIN_137261 [Trichonephila inaurata madagascariensis]